ncbi:DnaB-like dsDNA helicase [Mycobacterium phage Myrna]|uniref:DnaB-like dsDNA helicase n=1 Tax=Mycobacterium phage Myrna TaxID=546805 RepID=B5LJF9_9CAUD|nr:gp187 [Mycobacterium phage Myrna]ACH62156.1 DnaB-like dsDNA helicase [Mycobacterium phage Myrna]
MSDLESKMIGKMIGDHKVIDRLWGMGLRETVFEDPINRVIFEWIVDYWQKASMQLAPTWVVMETEFPGQRFEHDVEESTEWLVSALQRRYTLNQAQEILLSAGKTLHEDPIATLSKLWRDAHDITERTVARTSRVDMAENIEQRRMELEARRTAVAGGVPYGLPMIDEHTHGLLDGELCAVAAFTKVGKSWMLCHSAIQAHLAGLKPIVFTLEMSIKEMTHRIDAFASGVGYNHISSGDMLPQDRTRLHEAQDALAARGPLLVERPERGERTVKYMVNRARQVGANVMMIDQLSFMDAEGRYQGDQALRFKHGEIMFDLKDEISRESAGALPCMLAVQLNRDSQRGDGGRGQLHNFANSSFIEQTVDVAFGLWRNENMRNNNVMGIDTMGTRRGDRQNWLLGWRLSDRTEITVRGVNEE